MEAFFSLMNTLEDFLWSYLALFTILSLGSYFTLKSKFFQFTTLCSIKKTFTKVDDKGHTMGINPYKLYFASAGGMIGVGNIATVTTAITIGGPGALFWLWVASVLGMLVKYSDIYLGITHRIPNKKGGYEGGPMYYLMHAFKSKAPAILVAFFLCIYGTEVSQFLTITDTVVINYDINRYLVIAVLLALVFATVLGEVKFLATLCTVVMPPLMICYLIAGLYVCIDNIAEIPQILNTVVHSAFYGHAPIGGFAGSTILLAAHFGASRAVYSGDIGIGYDATIHSETRATNPAKQARMGIFLLFTDTIVCTISMLIILVTGTWIEKHLPSEYVMLSLMPYSEFAKPFITMVIIAAAFTTITGYLVVGMRAARFLWKEIGVKVYLAVSMLAFITFSFQDQEQVMLIMSVAAGLLMIINLMGIFKLRKQISFR